MAKQHDEMDPTYTTHRDHSPHFLKKQLLISLTVFFFLIVGTVAVVLWGSGYRFGFESGQPVVNGTGLLVASSLPKGAQVLIDGELSTATDNTINLRPGEYTIQIIKEGFFPWEKKVRIQEKVVTSVDALLFPLAPKLESITASGIEDPVLDPTNSKIAFKVVESPIPAKNGIYVYDMAANPVLALQGTSRQIANDDADLFSQSDISWSPDGADVIATVSGTLGQATYLLDSSSSNQSPVNITGVIGETHETWMLEKMEKDEARLKSFKKPVQKLITDHFNIISYSPDDTKILYVASRSAELPLMITPRPIGTTNTLEETRTIEEGSIYVYDITEDVNVKPFDQVPDLCPEEIPDCKQPLVWFPDSEHIIYINDTRIDIMGYDGSNRKTVYAGPFVQNYVFPWPNGSKLVILTNLNNPDIKPNLYTVGLK